MKRSHRRTTATLVAALAGAALLVSCGDGDTIEETGPGESRPTGPGEVVVQVMVAGGFVPLEAAVTAVPTLTVLGDGTVITQAPVAAIYPGPAIVPLQASTAEDRTVDELVRRADELGLLAGPLEFGRPPVADAPDTTVTINAGGETHTHTAYALGITDERAPGEPAGISEQEAANREALKAFLDATEQLPPGERQWQPPAVAVYVLGDYRPEPELPQTPMPWPLAEEPATTGPSRPCTLIGGGDVPVLLDALTRANALTPWVIGGRQLSLAFRPVLPGQPGCPDS